MYNPGQADLQTYRQGYPGKKDDPRVADNIEFYTNKRKCRPDNLLIDELHVQWYGKYGILERHHGYIQWLFPIREHGLNALAVPLQAHEALKMAQNPKVMQRVMRSLDLMLDFYGTQLDPASKAVTRRSNYAARFKNLCNNSHNFLRITRILKFLGEVGLERYKAPLLRFWAKEAFGNDRLLAGCIRSLCEYWVHTLKDDSERAEIARYVSDQRTALLRDGPRTREGGKAEKRRREGGEAEKKRQRTLTAIFEEARDDTPSDGAKDEEEEGDWVNPIA
eukprot:Hpha_TRINITY_DN15175_c1_g7::TRINITY_DN15175_c1_g7_i1::g.127629::m.127629